MVVFVIVSERKPNATAAAASTAADITIIRCDAYPFRGRCILYRNDPNYYNQLDNEEMSHEKLTKSADCMNLLSDECGNGQMIGSAIDDKYLAGANTPGKRSYASLNMFDAKWLEQYLPKLSRHPLDRKCINLGDDGCANGQIPGAGLDDEFLIGNGTPGKRTYMS